MSLALLIAFAVFKNGFRKFSVSLLGKMYATTILCFVILLLTGNNAVESDDISIEGLHQFAGKVYQVSLSRKFFNLLSKAYNISLAKYILSKRNCVTLKSLDIQRRQI